MKNINVLIVDDQINVVSGVMFGVHWGGIIFLKKMDRSIILICVKTVMMK